MPQEHTLVKPLENIGSYCYFGHNLEWSIVSSEKKKKK